MYTPEMLAESMTKISRFTEEAERPADTVRGGLFIFTCVHDDRDTALAMANERLSRQYQQDFSKMVAKYTLAGSPQDCVERLREYIDAGATTIMFSPGCPADYVEKNTRLIAEAVVPAFR
jgi:alkanesulfonate monooxygenase SsuD/methylene tetrahydromethanopterin reductase-like flavin-dependent oxidoreductase (luciferase family)